MMKRLIILVLAALCTASFAADVSMVRKPFVVDTVLVAEGRPNAVIVAPETREYRQLADEISAAIRDATGAPLPVRSDSDYASMRGELKLPEPNTNLIVIGNQDSSGLVTYLCLMGYCAVDTLSPGKGGYMIRTVHDPWGNGVNLIALLGSDPAGVRLAVERFCARLSKGLSLTVPRTVDVRYSAQMLKKIPLLAVDPSDEDIAKQLRDVEAAFLSGLQGGLFNAIVGAGNNYNSTGHESYARLFRELIYLAERLSVKGQGSFGGPWGAAADFLFGPLITAWDNVEESPSLTDAERAHIVSIIIDYIHYWEEHGYVRGIEKPLLRTNHWTFEGQGWLAAGKYFGKYYDMPESAKWLQMADWCFGHQMKSYQPQEDCGAYQYITLRHMCRYATTRQDYSWFDSGKGRMAGDLAIMCMDNLGYQASFGDVAGFSPGSHLGPLQMLATVERDGRWVWAIEKCAKALYGNSPWSYPNHVGPKEPTDLLGVTCMPTDPLFYDTFKGNSAIPQDRTFEKITFRRSFDPDDAYLLLDGLSGCYHGHWDGNSVLRHTDRGRIWLADSDYIKSLPKFHNSMLIFKDGESTGLPIFSEREIVADLPSCGMTRTTTYDYGGADWSRNILWDKGHIFVFFDEMQANSTDDYSFRCYWQTLGQPTLDGSLFRTTQDGPSLSIRNLDGARVRYTDDPVIGQNWKAYKHADPIVRTLQQLRTQRLPKGGRVCIVNVLSTEARGATPIEAWRVSDNSILLGARPEQALVGLGTGDTEIAPGIRTDARMYWLTSDAIALGGATSLVVGGQTLLQSDRPVDTELRIPRDFEVKFPRAMPLPVAAVQTIQGAEQFHATAQFAPKTGKCTALASNGSTIYVGSTDGKVYALDANGQMLWDFDAGSSIRAIWAGKLDKEGPVRIAVGTIGSAVCLLDEEGGLVWKKDLPYFKQDACVVYFTTADLAGDGNRALIVGAENWHTYAFDSVGNQLWAFEILHASTAGTGVDLDGDGREEVIAGSDYYSWRAVRPDGTQLWDYRPIGARTNCVLAGDVTGSGKPLVLFGGADGYLHAVDAAGKRQWLYNTADEITGMALMDVDGDGVQDVVIGSLSFSITAVKGDGTRIWRTDVGEPVTCLVLADLDGDGSEEICAGTEDGHVLALGRDGKPLATWSAGGTVSKLDALRVSPARIAVVRGDGGIVLLGMD